MRFTWWPFQRPERPAFVERYLSAAQPALSLPWRAAPYSVIDVETSGLDRRRDALLAIGLAEIEDGRVQIERCWESLIRPPAHLRIPAETIRVHRLFHSDLAEAPPIDEVLPALLGRLAGRVLVVHVATIDMGFIDAALRPYGAKLRGPALDTARLAITLHQQGALPSGYGADMPAIALRGLAEQANLPVYPEHNALNDALTTAQLFLHQAVRLEQQGSGTLRGLLQAGGGRR